MTPDQMAACRYVLLTTRKRSGEDVATAVWIAPLGVSVAGFTTAADSGKVKRIRNFPDVTVQPCDARGRTQPGAEILRATASIVTGADFAPVRQAVKQKYGIQFQMIELVGTIREKITRRTAADCGVVLRFGD